jgi:hypothetical protein
MHLHLITTARKSNLAYLENHDPDSQRIDLKDREFREKLTSRLTALEAD